MTRPSDSQQKRTYRIVNFAVPANHIVKIKEHEKRDRYLDLSREQKNPTKLYKMEVTGIPMVIGALGTIPKVLVKEREDL